MNNKNEFGKVKLTANILFSGIGAQERGFRNTGLFDVDVLTTSDIDKEAVVSYAAIHCGLTKEMIEEYTDYPSREEMAQYLTDINLGYDTKKNEPYDWMKLARRKNKALEKFWLACKLTNNLGDISRIKELPYADLWTVSFPCQDISVAGNMKGLSPDSGTRSSLLWENMRLLKQAVEDGQSPEYIMFENVKNLVSKKFIQDFNNLIDVLKELGFNTYWKVINGKDCGIPQNRERVFAFAIREDIDNCTMDFPKPFDNGLRLKDILEMEVDEKYYISDEQTQRFIEKLKLQALPLDAQTGIDKSVNNTSVIEYANCITAREDRGVSNRQAEGTAVLENTNTVKQIGNMSECNGGWANPQVGRIYSDFGISPTLNTCGDGQREPKVLCCGNVNPSGRGMNGTVYASDGLAPTLTTNKGEGNKIVDTDPKILQTPRGFNKGGLHEDCTAISAHSWECNNFLLDNIRIRKLTPKECWRLMGFDDEDVDNAMAVNIANCQLYKQAGNSIITNCVALLAEHLYKAQYHPDYVCYDENFTRPQTE